MAGHVVRKVWFVGTVWVALFMMACGGSNTPSTEGGLNVRSRGFANTSYVRYVIEGDGIVDGNVGAYVVPGEPEFPVHFSRLPEGFKGVHVIGYDYKTADSPNPTEFPTGFYFGTGGGYQETTLIGGSTSSVDIIVAGAIYNMLGAEKEILNGDYQFDLTAPYAGSPDGGNITRLVLDNALPNTTITLELGQSVDYVGNSAGLFTALPDPIGGGGNWPLPDSWDQTLDLVTDASGDATCYFVAAPHPAGRLVSLTAKDGFSIYAYMSIRIAGVASLGGSAVP